MQSVCTASCMICANDSMYGKCMGTFIIGPNRVGNCVHSHSYISIQESRQTEEFNSDRTCLCALQI